MNTRAILGVALTGVVILVSCTQDNASAPSLVPTDATFAKPPRATCDFTVMRAAAKTYFADLKDPVYAKIDAMQDAYRVGGVSNTTTTGFAVLAQTAASVKGVSGAGAISGEASDGNAFVHEVFKCMSVAGYGPTVSFTASLGDEGLFDVIDGTAANARAVIARYNVGNSPAFGAEPNGGNWPVTGPTLFYGSAVDVSVLSNEVVKGTVADLKTLPVYSQFASKFKAGVCKVTDVNARALHQHTVNSVVDATILSPVQLSFCIGFDEDLVMSGPMSSFALGLKRATSWLAPRPLYAAAMPTRFGGGGAGLVDGLSEIGPVSFTSVVSFATFPKTIRLSKQPQTFTVLNETANGNPLAGVTITLTVVGNSGSFTNPPIGNTAVTDDNGIATFDQLFLDKSGGYTITASSPLGGSAPATFNVTGN